MQTTINSRKIRLLEISLSGWMKGGVIVTNSKKCTTYSHYVAICKHVHHEYRNYIHIMYTLKKVSPMYTKDYLENCATKRIGYHILSQEFVSTWRKKEILKVVMFPLVYTHKWISKNRINKNDVPCVASQVIQKANAPTV